MPPDSYPVPPSLSNYVHEFWSVERHTTPDRPHIIRPDDKVELVFSFGVAWNGSVEGTVRELSPVYIVGLVDESIPIVADGLIRMLSVRFHPWGFNALLDEFITMPLTGLSIPSHPLFYALAMQFRPRGNEHPRLIIPMVCEFLVSRALKCTFNDPELMTTAQKVMEGQIKPDVAQLAKSHAMPESELQFKFDSITGFLPTEVARLDKARGLLWADPSQPINSVAAEAGYADGAEMEADFRRYTEQTANSFAMDMQALKLRWRGK